MKIEIPGIDAEKGLDLYDGDFDMYLAVLRSYAAKVPAALNKLRTVTAETLPDYTITVHGVKGTSTNIGAEETRIAASKLEAMAKAGDLSGVLAANETFLKQADKLLKDIQSWLKEFDGKSGNLASC